MTAPASASASPEPEPEPEPAAGRPAPVRVRYWAAAREACGTDVELVDVVEPACVQDVLDQVSRAHPGLGGVLRVASVLADGRRVDPTARVAPGCVLEVLPPFAGG